MFWSVYWMIPMLASAQAEPFVPMTKGPLGAVTEELGLLRLAMLAIGFGALSRGNSLFSMFFLMLFCTFLGFGSFWAGWVPRRN